MAQQPDPSQSNMQPQAQYADDTHQAFIGQVNQTDLQAQVFVRNMNQKQRDNRQKELAAAGGLPGNAFEGQQFQDPASMSGGSNYMQMQQPAGMGPLPTLGALRMIKDSKKNEWQLGAEVAELKKQRNKDLNHIKILKVELTKLELLFKKYKENIPVDATP